ncbi:hypothetical protein ILYODFUR_026705 [Ilyodon furcidens]|uniref:Uncharacterized protein n=1 Tax=Ilyodon furcidens TaxID=33524 RepID=A0ABV0T237_9TELE
MKVQLSEYLVRADKGRETKHVDLVSLPTGPEKKGYCRLIKNCSEAQLSCVSSGTDSKVSHVLYKPVECIYQVRLTMLLLFFFLELQPLERILLVFIIDSFPSS